MLEFLYTTLVLLVFCFLVFIIFPAFKYAKMVMIVMQLIFSFILVSKNFYKNYDLYDSPRFQYIQSTNFYPINSLYKTYDINEDISYNTMNDNKFSLIQSEKYPTQCLEHYFISKDETCPITDIKFENKQSNIYQNYIDMSYNEYLYYTNQNKIGKLYKSFNYTDFKNNKENALTHEDIDKIARKEFNKISNPILDLKYFIQFFDSICPMLIITSLCFSFFEHADDLKLGVLRISNILLQLIILIIYLVRFNKFIEVKHFLFDNEDIYKNSSYYPHKIFNIDSFPLAFSINIFIINTLYIAFPNHELCLKVPKNFLSFDKETIILFYIIFFFVSKFIFEILDFVNDAKIINTYNDLIDNWELPPIKLIEILNSIEKEEINNI